MACSVAAAVAAVTAATTSMAAMVNCDDSSQFTIRGDCEAHPVEFQNRK